MKRKLLDLWYKKLCVPFRFLKRLLVYRKNLNSCWYCQKHLVFSNFTIDHYVPLSGGGSNWISNLVPACYSCNKLKRNLEPTERVLQAIRIARKNNLSRRRFEEMIASIQTDVKNKQL